MSVTVAIVLGAGKGVRATQAINKVFVDLAGVPMIVRSTRPFVEHPAVSEVVVVVDPDETDLCSRTFKRAGISVSAIIPGGPTRHKSEACALEALRARIERGEIELVLIHDGARPMFDPSGLEALVERARSTGGAMYGLPLTDELVKVENGTSSWQGGSEALWVAQTPQAFRADVLLEAFDVAAAAGFEGTDTAASVERIGQPIEIVPGQPTNLKITFPEDMILVQSLLAHSEEG